MVIDDTLINHLQRLSKLSLTPDERVQIKKDLSDILVMVDKITEVELDGIAPLTHMNPSLSNTLRDDVPHDSLTAKDLKKIAPLMKGDYIALPKVIEKRD